jgi:hypothetical protein
LRLSPSWPFQMRVVAMLKLVTGAPLAVKRISGIAPM